LPPLIKTESEIGGGAGDLTREAVARFDILWGK
jgi:16S rRNA A1518/A1519 N6-dimethyltransferase RsmA/KsgA/DIM1 with predicted DNA glycosylase/AP lyase activity